MAAGAGLATLVRGHRLRRSQEEETLRWSKPWPAILAGLRPDPSMLRVAVRTFMKPAYRWPGACFFLRVAEGGTETIRAPKPSINRTCIAALRCGRNVRAAGQQRLSANVPTRPGLAGCFFGHEALSALLTRSPLRVTCTCRRTRLRRPRRNTTSTARRRTRSGARRRGGANERSHGACARTERPPANSPTGGGIATAGSCGDKRAIELVRQGKPSDATLIETSIGDPVAQKLVEWTLLRHPESEVQFERYAAFIRANPNWPSMRLLRRRAEAKLWQDRRDAATVRRFFGEEHPTSTLGRLAFARVLRAEGDEAGAALEARAAWRSAELSAELEAAVLDEFRDELTRSGPRGTSELAHKRRKLRRGDARCKAARGR